MKTRLLVVLVVLAVLASFATPVSAQIGKIQGAPRPGMIVGSIQPPAPPEKPTGLTGEVKTYNGEIVPNASVIVSLVKYDGRTGRPFADPSTKVVFGPCKGDVRVDCIDSKTYHIKKESLPAAEYEYDQYRTLDIRVDAPGYTHWLTDEVRVGFDGNSLVTAPVAEVYPNGFKMGKAYAWYPYSNVLAIGFWAKQDWEEKFVTDFFFAGSAWTVAQVKYGSVSTLAEIGPGPDGYGVWVETWFWAPKNNTAEYGGSICGDIQIRPTYGIEYTRAQTKQVCTKLYTPLVDYYNNNR